ncbi:hypothetical protein DCAR_0101978 [Daucus carota subsp. sativus]|uniref:Pentacotripeptide-repeat region of PRORP domain-containing protein n=1 Tax=Daucus carota subsp. sativus TaxID=79200 RepID=A0AAF0W702_DAUCS|nr:PREDICTED: pentatricopeptide repeat-containing protein At1g09190 [Daucus carota subsp. sativus]WOG82810.1 hypothetical protein DCAR_0101978 [Daucus carota subsp. sativus]
MSMEIERRILRLLHGHKTRFRLREIHGHFLRHHLHRSNQLLSHFISVCAASNKLSYAYTLFRHSPNPNILLFNSIIKAFSCPQSFHFFSVMRNRGIWPNEFTFSPLFKACSNMLDVRMGQGLHGEVVVMGFECFSQIRIALVELYCKCGRMEDARQVFDEMFQRDVIVWNLMVSGFCRTGDVESGLLFFRGMTERTVVSWNSMISGLAQCGRDSEAMKLFEEMRNCGFVPDETTVVIILPICARLGEDGGVGKWIHSYAKSSGLILDFISVGNSLIDYYCKRGALERAFSVFRDMPQKNVVTWNAMISGQAFNGNGERGLTLFEEMIDEHGVTPNDATFVGALTCCSHAGWVKRGGELLTSMVSNYGIHPKLEHYGCMVDLLGRGGCVKEAYDLINAMPMKPNAAIWGSLLNACRQFDDIELAVLAVKELIKVEPCNSGNYVLLSNLYAEKGLWDEVENIRLLMKKNSLQKEPGQSIV